MNNHGSLLVPVCFCLGLGLAGEGVARAQDSPPEGAAVSYAVPIEAPTGEVQVMSLGVADLPRPSRIGTERFVHMRLAAHNQRDVQPWVLDSRDQLIELPDGTTLPPRFAESSNPASAAHVVLELQQRGYLDLFFAVDDDFDPAWTSLVWRVRRGSGMIVARTVFERLPDPDSLYAHYWPAQYEGGQLVIGALWCLPAWDWPWADSLRPWGHYRRYRYHRRPGGGFGVSDGHARWDYHRGRPPVIARPAPAQPDPRPTPSPSDRARWQWQVERTLLVPTDSGGMAASTASPSSSSSAASSNAPSPPQPSTTESSPSPSVSRFQSSHSSSFSPSPSFSSSPSHSQPSSSSGSSSSDSSSSGSSSSGSSSPSPSSSSASSSAPSSPPPSEPSRAPSGDSVGSRWRAR